MATEPLLKISGLRAGIDDTPILKGIDLEIGQGEIHAIMGRNGSGKTTTVDIILGLIEAQDGSLEVDGKVIDKDNKRAWQNSIGYVPQQIFLADDTISANIAFGKKNNEINQDDVERASKIANLHEFVINELPLKYQTLIGEKGIRLPGGQRQRIAIARALLRKPSVLVLDDSTSAVDPKVEAEILQNIKTKTNCSLLVIAHRLATIRLAERVIFIDDGKVSASGSHDELLKIDDYANLVSAYEDIKL